MRTLSRPLQTSQTQGCGVIREIRQSFFFSLLFKPDFLSFGFRYRPLSDLFLAFKAICTPVQGATSTSTWPISSPSAATALSIPQGQVDRRRGHESLFPLPPPPWTGLDRGRRRSDLNIFPESEKRARRSLNQSISAARGSVKLNETE